MPSYIVKKKEVDIPKLLRDDVEICLIDRTDSEEYYKRYSLGRTDIATLQIFDICNIFYFVSGRFQIDLWEVKLDDEDTEKLNMYAEKMFEKIDKAFIQKQIDFFNRIGNTYGLK